MEAGHSSCRAAAAAVVAADCHSEAASIADKDSWRRRVHLAEVDEPFLSA